MYRSRAARHKGSVPRRGINGPGEMAAVDPANKRPGGSRASSITTVEQLAG